MRSKALAVDAHMSRSPHTVGRRQSLAEAHALMRAHRIRHLPVVDGGRLVGLVSLRDLHLLETLQDVDPASVQVDEAMTRDPYRVRAGTPLRRVARAMSRRRLGSAVVVDGRGRVLGVFTTVDALGLLARLLDGGRSRTRT